MIRESRLIYFAGERMPEYGSKAPSEKPKTPEDLQAQEREIEEGIVEGKKREAAERSDREADEAAARRELEELAELKKEDASVSYELSAKAYEVLKKRGSAKDKMGSLKDLLKGSSQIAEVYGIRFKEDKDKLLGKSITSDVFIPVTGDVLKVFVRSMRNSAGRGMEPLPFKQPEPAKVEEKKEPEVEGEVLELEPVVAEEEEEAEPKVEIKPKPEPVTAEDLEGVGFDVEKIREYLRRNAEVKNFKKVKPGEYAVKKDEVDSTAEGLYDFLAKRDENPSMIFVAGEGGEKKTYLWNPAAEVYTCLSDGENLVFDPEKAYRVSVYKPKVETEVPKKRLYTEVEDGQFIVGMGGSSIEDFYKFVEWKKPYAIDEFRMIVLTDLQNQERTIAYWDPEKGSYMDFDRNEVKLNRRHNYKVRPTVRRV